MTAATDIAKAKADAAWLELTRDDGPLARALGRLLGPLLPVSPPLLLIASVLPFAAALAAGGAHPGRAALAPGIAVLVLLGGASAGRPTGRFGWLAPGLLRALEYTLILWMAALAGGWATRPAYALLAVLAFRHYDAIYRVRYAGRPPALPARAAGLGWEIRLLLVYALLLAGVADVGMIALATALAGVSVGESAAGWLTLSRAGAPASYADEEEIEE